MRLEQDKPSRLLRGMIVAAIILALILAIVLCLKFGHILPYALPNDPLLPEQKSLSAIHMEAAWEKGLTGKGVTIAIIDTGVADHEDLDAKRISGKSYVDEDGTQYSDERGHGTFIAGLLAARRNNGKGITGMTDSKIIAYKVIGDQPHIEIDYVAEAIRAAADAGCDVINLSMGTPNDNQKMKEAVDYAVEKGAIVIAAAGGDAETPYYPASYENVIGVDAISENFLELESAVKNDSVFVTAPGRKIVSLDFNGGYERDGAGASYAAAHVTALAAFAKQSNPDLTVEEFAALLKETARDLGEPGYDNVYGYGVIDVEKMIDALLR